MEVSYFVVKLHFITIYSYQDMTSITFLSFYVERNIKNKLQHSHPLKKKRNARENNFCPCIRSKGNCKKEILAMKQNNNKK